MAQSSVWASVFSSLRRKPIVRKIGVTGKKTVARAKLSSKRETPVRRCLWLPIPTKTVSTKRRTPQRTPFAIFSFHCKS